MNDVENLSSPLGSSLRSKFDEAKRARASDIEDRWLRALRQNKGVYEDDEKPDGDRSQVFLSMTRLKVETLTRLMMASIFGTKDDNWTIEPTPNPRLTQSDQQAIIQQVIAAGQQPTPDLLDTAMREMAKIKAEKMSKAISDHLSENEGMRYKDVVRSCITSGNLFGTGVIKGPLIKQTLRREWRATAGGEWAYETVKTESQQLGPDGLPVIVATPETVKLPYLEARPVWSIFPDLSATSLGDAQFIFDRYVMAKSDLMELADRDDFDGDAINAYIKAYPDGDCDTYESYEADLMTMGEDNRTTPKREKRYEVVEFWGLLSGEELIDAGVTSVPEDQGHLDFWANVWFVGDVLLKADLNPLDGVNLPYYFYYFSKDETSIFGEGIPDKTHDIQSAINASYRMILDNGAIAALPIFEVFTHLLKAGEDPTSIRGGRVIQRDGDPSYSGTAAVRILTVPTMIAEGLKILELSMQLLDEISGVSKMDQGNTDQDKTATEASIMASRSNSSLSDQVARFDDTVTIPMIRSMYNWEMQFNPDANIKGDMEVKAKGNSGVQMKELKSQAMLAFRAQIGQDPALMKMVDWDKFLRIIATNSELPEEVIRTEQEVQGLIQQEQQQMAQAQAAEAGKRFVAEARELNVPPLELAVTFAQQSGLVVNPQVAQQMGLIPQQGQPQGQMPPQPQPGGQAQPMLP